MIGNQIRMQSARTSHAQIDTRDCQTRDMLLRGAGPPVRWRTAPDAGAA